MTKQAYGLTLNGIIRVFRKDKEIDGKNKVKFTVTDVWFNTSEKNEDGDYYNISTNLIFPRNTELPENNKVIEIVQASPMITGTGKYRKIVYFVKDWNYKTLGGKDNE